MINNTVVRFSIYCASIAVSSGFLVTILLLQFTFKNPDAALRECDEYCENSHKCGTTDNGEVMILQPANAWTNLAYLAAGLWPFVMNRVDLSTAMFLFGNLYLCIGSFMLHATLTSFWSSADVGGMFTVLLILVAQGLLAVAKQMKWRWWSALIIMALGLVFPYFKDKLETVGFDARFLLLSFVFMFTLLQVILLARIIYSYRRSTARNKIWSCIWVVVEAVIPHIILAVAILLRAYDREKKWCEPSSLWQGHAAWHGLTAIAMYLLWRFFDHRGRVGVSSSEDEKAANNNSIVANSTEEFSDVGSKEENGMELGLGAARLY